MTKFHETPFKTSDERLAAAALPVRDRQEMIETLLYKYPVFKTGEKFIEDFHFPYGREAKHGTGTIGGLLGSSRVGKSTVCTYYAAHQPRQEVDENGESYPIVHVTMNAQTTPSSLADILANATGMRSIPSRVKADGRMRMVYQRLIMVKTQLVIIDDAQFLFNGKNAKGLHAFQTVIKDMADLHTLNVLLVGEETIREAIDNISFLEGRGSFPHETLRALGDAGKEFEGFRILLSRIDMRLPFKAQSVLHESSRVAADLHAFTGGSIGRVMNLVRAAAAMAINDGAACIMLEHLQRASIKLARLGDDRQYFGSA